MSAVGRTLAVGLAALLTLGGCSVLGGGGGQEIVYTTVTTTPGVGGGEAADAPSPQAAGDQQPAGCSELTGRQAAEKWVGEVPTMNDWAWDTEWAVVDDYDPCAALSWIVLPIESGTASSPYQIMLFHRGEYLGTTFKEPEGFAPGVTRLSDDAIEVTYRYTLHGDSNAGARGRAVAQFTWDAAQGKVVHTGALPPSVQQGGGGGSASAAGGSAGAGAATGSGNCGRGQSGYGAEAGESTSCAFALAVVDEMARIGPPSPGIGGETPHFRVASPVTGQTYTMRCSGGTGPEGGGNCFDMDGGSAIVGWSPPA